ncbi:MAG: bifunctional oligoribonuclease/PAP phosphatase NrnA [Solobacterium sp.]|nr:bifunctional oligoribonuclease/PAP phosphatase NrnA [Solobacterium sp.]
MDFSELTCYIEQADTITLFRHANPDCDASGSQFGMKNWLNTNYPDKKVYAIGNDVNSQSYFGDSDTVSDDVIKGSLAIVLDTANIGRIDDPRALTASRILKIDHHPDYEPFGDDKYVDVKAAATCEILADYFHWTGKEISHETAVCLYKGILTDTLCFRTSNTTSNTLLAASYLAACGLNIPEINRDLFDQDLHDFRVASYIRANVTIHDRFAYLIIPYRTLQEWQLTPSQARNFIDEIGHVTDFTVWAIITENDKGLYDGSLRSKYADISVTARKFGGGGHKNACGVKDLEEKTMYSLLEELYMTSGKD